MLVQKNTVTHIAVSLVTKLPEPCAPKTLPEEFPPNAAPASAPLPCKQGTYSTQTVLVSRDECTETDPGFFAPTGSMKQLPCAAGVEFATFFACEYGTTPPD